MSDDIQTVKTGWSSVQVYTLSAICLLVGVTMGYLYRGSTAAQAPGASAPAAVQTQTPEGASAPPTPEAMKRMADKQVAPLLEQLKTDPNNAGTLDKVAHFYLVAGQFNDAATYYDKETTVKPTAEGLTQLAIADYYGGAGDKAIDALNRALKIDPKSANALYNLGMLKWQVKGDVNGAVECWQTLLNTNLDASRRAQVEQMIARAKEHAKIPAGTKTDKPAM